MWQHCHRSSYYTFPGTTLGTMPSVLPAVKQFIAVDGSGEVPPIGESSTSFPAMSQLLSEADVDVSGKASLPLPATASKPAAEILLGHGIPPLPKKMVERMINWEYVDFSELPPAKISGLKAPMDNGTILLVQSADLLKQQRRLIPNITVWVQCFCIYAGVMAMKHPDSIPDMLAYMREIVQANNQYRWPSWVIYDSSYRKQAAASGNRDWSKVDPSIYSRSFTGWAKSTSWCELCVTLDHDTADCPYNIKPSYGQVSQPSATRSQLFGLQLTPKGRSGPRSSFICIKYNKYGGDCKYGASCRYKRVCSSCKGNHPRTKCSSKQASEEEKSKTVVD